MNKKTKDDKSISLLSSFVYVRGVLSRSEALALDSIIYSRILLSGKPFPHIKVKG